MKILGFGEVLWDEIHNKLNIGGTVFNFIAHCKKMGADSYLLSAVGNDELGKKVIDFMDLNGINREFIKIVDIPTCIVKVSFDKNNSPAYYLDKETSWDFIDIDDHDLSLINEIAFDYFCFGTLAQRNIINSRSLKTIIKKCKFPKIFCDMNLRLSYYDKSKIEYSMKTCDILKLNEEELLKIKDLFIFKENNHKDLVKRICKQYDIKILCITKGEAGAYIYSDTNFIFCPGYKVKVRDTVGAGDAFSAALITKLYDGYSIKDACEFACKVGATITSYEGAVPEYNLIDVNDLVK